MSGFWRPTVLAGAVAAASTLIFSRPDTIVFWPDSIAYFSSAESLVQHGAFINHQNAPLTLFPPVYPTLVAITRALGLDRQNAAFLINLAATIAIAVVACRIAWMRTASIGATLAILVACLAAGPMPMRYRYAASELPFIALTLVALDATDRRIWRAGAVRAFSLGLLCGVIFLTRYSGLAVAGVIGLWLLADWRWDSRRTVVAALSFGTGCALPPAGWVMRNVVLTGDALGPRRDAITSLPQSLTETASSLVDWSMPRVWWANGLTEWVIVFGAFAAAAGGAYFLTRPEPPVHRTVTLHLSFAFAYIGFIVYSSTVTAIDTINERLLAPAYIPAVLALGLAAYWAVPRQLTLARPALRIAGTAAVLAFVVSLASLQAMRRPAPEVDFMSPGWRESPTTREARAIVQPPLCFSNAPGPLYLGTDHRCGRALTAPYRSVRTTPDQLLEWLDTGDTRTAYYVWYYHSDPQEMVGDPHTLLAGHIVHARRTADGEILTLRSAPPDHAAGRSPPPMQSPR